MPKWSQYLDEDFEDDYQRFEKFKPRNNPQRVDEERKPESRRDSVNQDKK